MEMRPSRRIGQASSRDGLGLPASQESEPIAVVRAFPWERMSLPADISRPLTQYSLLFGSFSWKVQTTESGLHPPLLVYLFFPADKLWATAARIRSFKVDASILSP